MNILLIETATEVCSVGLARDGEVVALRESREGRDHARTVAVFAQEVLREAGIEASDLNAVAVSKGPGSYTGLRIGVAFAKGLCYALDIPLIGIGSLESLANSVINNSQFSIFNSQLIIPMIDARRMEVYAQVFDGEGRALTEPEAVVVDEGSFSKWRKKSGDKAGDGEIFIFGNGAQKCRETLPWARFLDVEPSVQGMARLAAEALEVGKTENIAYFEPLYLKDFVATTSKKNNLGI